MIEVQLASLAVDSRGQPVVILAPVAAEAAARRLLPIWIGLFEANAIALGRYGSEATARRRETALRTAGFPVQAQPLGDVAVAHWLDVAAGPAFDVAAARAASAAAEARDIDCAGVTGSGAPTR